MISCRRSISPLTQSHGNGLLVLLCRPIPNMMCFTVFGKLVVIAPASRWSPKTYQCAVAEFYRLDFRPSAKIGHDAVN